MAKKGYFSAKNVAWRDLPSGYTQVEYIESSGTQYIDTGFKPNQNTGVTMDFEVTDTSVTSWLFCGRTAANNSAYGVYAYTGGSKFYFVYGTGSTNFSGTAAQRQICTVEKNKCNINGTSVTITEQTFTSSATLCLLARNTGGTIAGYAMAKLYSCKIYDNGTLIRDYVPCLNVSGAAGLYDMVNGVFYGNAGTGSFSVGETLRENVAREAKKVYFADNNGIARMAKKAYFGDKNGIARLFYRYGTPISSIAVGESVFMNVNGVRTEFLVVHQGLPSSAYDASCDGTWLLMKECYEERAWDSTNNDYENSDIHSYLNNTFVNLFDSEIGSFIKQVKIPYTKGTGTKGSLVSGVGGLSVKVFLLSYAEVGYVPDTSIANTEGSALGFFKGMSWDDPKRCTNLKGDPIDYYCDWFFRCPYIKSDTSILGVGVEQAFHDLCTRMYGVRPAFVLPSDTLVDENFNVIA